jgi:carbon-monoxide dehydrogenase large subunit
MATIREPPPAPTSGAPDRLRPLKRKEDARFIRGKGTYLDDIRCPGCCTARSCAARTRTRGSSRSTPRARSRTRRSPRSSPAKDLETLGLAWMPTISYDTQAVLATDKVRFQGQEVAFVVADRPYSARDALELIDVEYEPLPAVVDARKALDPDAPLIRDDKEGRPTTSPSSTGRPATRRPPTAAFAEADTSSSRDIIYPRCTRRRWRRAARSPTSTRSTASSTSTTATRRRTRTARSTRTSPGSAEHKIRIICRHRRRLRQQGAGLPRLRVRDRGSIVTGAGQVDRGPLENLMSTGFARDYVMHGEIAPTKDGKITRPARRRARRPRRVQRDRAADEVPGRLLPHRSPAPTTSRPRTCKVKAASTRTRRRAASPTAARSGSPRRSTSSSGWSTRSRWSWASTRRAAAANFIRPEQFPYETTTGWTYDSGDYAETMRVAMEIAGYDELRREQAEKRAAAS